jgi:hypothetical protein
VQEEMFRQLSTAIGRKNNKLNFGREEEHGGTFISTLQISVQVCGTPFRVRILKVNSITTSTTL